MHRMEIIMYFQNGTSTTPPAKKKKKGQKKMKVPLSENNFHSGLCCVHGKEIRDDFTGIKTEININNANVAIDWK